MTAISCYFWRETGEIPFGVPVGRWLVIKLTIYHPWFLFFPLILTAQFIWKFSIRPLHRLLFHWNFPFFLLWTKPPSPLAWSNAVSASLLPPLSPNFLPWAAPVTCHRHKSDSIISFTFSSRDSLLFWWDKWASPRPLQPPSAAHLILSNSGLMLEPGSAVSIFPIC